MSLRSRIAANQPARLAQSDRREHRYAVTFPEGTRPESGQRVTIVCHPDELTARLDASWPLREHPLTILDETAAAEWTPEWRRHLTSRDNTRAVLEGAPL